MFSPVRCSVKFHPAVKITSSQGRCSSRIVCDSLTCGSHWRSLCVNCSAVTLIRSGEQSSRQEAGMFIDYVMHLRIPSPRNCISRYRSCWRTTSSIYIRKQEYWVVRNRSYCVYITRHGRRTAKVWRDLMNFSMT